MFWTSHSIFWTSCTYSVRTSTTQVRNVAVCWSQNAHHVLLLNDASLHSPAAPLLQLTAKHSFQTILRIILSQFTLGHTGFYLWFFCVQESNVPVMCISKKGWWLVCWKLLHFLTGYRKDARFTQNLHYNHLTAINYNFKKD